jgi:predicted membrane-bound mannosyltransferase
MILVLAAIGFVASLRRTPAGAGAETTESPEGLAPISMPREPDPGWFRFIAFYTLIMTAAYAAIPYKTPWCLLGFHHGMILLAAMGFAFIWRACAPRGLRVAVALVTALGLAQLGAQAVRSNFTYYADPRNPYVYAHTGTDLVRLANKVLSLSKLHPDKSRMLVRVIANGSPQFPRAGDYWPLPWYFRRLERVGWYNQVPPDPRAPVIIASPSFEPALTAALGTNYQNAGVFGHRPRPAVFLLLFVQRDLWEKYVASPKSDEDE